MRILINGSRFGDILMEGLYFWADKADGFLFAGLTAVSFLRIG